MTRLILALVKWLMRWLPGYRLFDMGHPEDVRYLIKLWHPDLYTAHKPRRKKEATDER